MISKEPFGPVVRHGDDHWFDVVKWSLFAMIEAEELAEVVRGGLQAIPRQQEEAAKALGHSYWQRTWYVILPQALRIAIPPLVNTFIGFFKDTSLVVTIGLFDFLTTIKVSLTEPAWTGFGVEAYFFSATRYRATASASNAVALPPERFRCSGRIEARVGRTSIRS